MTGRVVLAEDDDGMAYAIRRMLEQGGYIVAAFTDSGAAWDALKTGQRPCLLVTDIRFPSGQTNGLALAAHAKQSHPNLPVIYVTGHPDVAKLVDPQRDGTLFLKPIDEAGFMRRVRELAPLTG